mmetsp:Transcript_31705/g.67132  ORF Transcript_31705/g.67132 Transcript_31705/m.67132 type:complete len:441 (+) Transcript_31705:60-1382(+)
MICVTVATLAISCFFISTDAFAISTNSHLTQLPPRQECHSLAATSSSSSTAPSTDTETRSRIPTGESYSTLTLLEHIHLLTPNVHGDITGDRSGNVVDFFVNTMGFGLDPKSKESVNNESGVAFVNCGASQLHLNDDSNYCQQMEKLQNDATQQSDSESNLPLFEIGLRYDDLAPLKESLATAGKICSFQIIDEGGEGETVRVTDGYGRTFVARAKKNNDQNDAADGEEPTISSLCQQKVIGRSEKDIVSYGTQMVETYGTESGTLCGGMDYIEFFVAVRNDDDGTTMAKIAKFYEFFFDAIASVAFDGTSHVAIIAFGRVDEHGRAEQSLLFRGRPSDDDDPPKDGGVVHDGDIGTGHHIAMYVGANEDDYEVAAANFMDGGLLWVNALFEDRVLDVETAMQENQFRFKDIIDIETGDVLYVLEHEVRSVSHKLFPGKK